MLHLRYRRGTVRIKDILCPEQIIQLALCGILCGDILPHAVAVQIAAALTHVIVSDLYPVGVGIHIAEIAETAGVQIVEAFIFCSIGMPVSNIRTKRIEDDIDRPDKGIHLILPLVRICMEPFYLHSPQIQVPPAVGGQLPAVILQALGNPGRFLAVLLAALALCGHGDKVLIADGNYPLDSKTGEAETVYLGLTPGLPTVTDVLAAIQAARIHGVSHITGGGFFENIPRCLPQGLSAKIDKSALKIPPIFSLLQEKGGIPERDMFNTFSMGVGMALIVDKEDVVKAVTALDAAGQSARVIGEVVSGDGGVELL